LVADEIQTALRGNSLGSEAVVLAEVVADHPGTVTVKTGLGAERIVDMPVGEQLPRIC
jgi:hydrogenase expression/formation protein HypE